MAEQLAERTAQVVTSEVRFNGNVESVSSIFLAANPEAGVRPQTITGATQLHGEDEALLAQLKEYHSRRFSDEW